MRQNPYRTLPAIALSLVLLLASGPYAFAQDGPVALGHDPRIAEAGVEISTFASGLDFPMGMIELPDGSLLVATSRPDGGSYFQSTGSLVRLTDQDSDGVTDDAGTVLAGDLVGPLVAIQRAGNLIFATSARGGAEAIYVFQRGERWRSPLRLIGTADFEFAGGEHQSYSLAVRRSPNMPGSYDLFFNVGAHGNLESGTTVGISGLISGSLDDASIYMTTVTEAGESVTFSEPVKIASGLRNASALLFAHKTGDLIIGENGIDTPENRIVSLSADEIDVIPAAKIGGEVEDFGFPTTYVDYQTGNVVGTDGIQPVVSFPPTDGSENEGIAGMAPVPASFPSELAGGYVAGFHGQFDSVGGDNEENPLLFFDLETGDRFELVANDNPGVGHLDSMTVAGDALFVADICATGLLAAADPCGVIYRITAGR